MTTDPVSIVTEAVRSFNKRFGCGRVIELFGCLIAVDWLFENCEIEGAVVVDEDEFRLWFGADAKPESVLALIHDLDRHEGPADARKALSDALEYDFERWCEDMRWRNV